MQTVVEIFTELSFADPFGQIMVGGSDHPYIDLDGGGVTDPFKFTFLEHPQQTHLHGRRNVADLVQEDGAAVGLLETAGLVGDGTGEGPLDVAEQFAFQQGLRQGRTVDLDERFAAAAAAGVQRLGHQLFAGAALAIDQHGAGYVGQGLDLGIDPLHRCAAADHSAEASAVAELPLQFVDAGFITQHHHNAGAAVSMVADR